MRANGALGFAGAADGLAIGATYTVGSYSDALAVTASSQVPWTAPGPGDSRLYLRGLAGDGSLISADDNFGYCKYAINGAFAALLTPSDADNYLWWFAEGGGAPEYGGMIWFDEQQKSVFIGVRATTTYSRSLIRFDYQGATGIVRDAALIKNVGTDTNPRFFLTRSRDGFLHIITQAGFYQKFDADLQLVEAYALPAGIYTANLRGFGIDGNAAVTLYNSGEGQASPQARFFDVGSSWAQIGQVALAEPVSAFTTRVIFNGTSAFLQRGAIVDRVAYSPGRFLERFAGDGATGAAGQILRVQVVAKSGGATRPSTPITWSLVSGSGAVVAQQEQTDSNGLAWADVVITDGTVDVVVSAQDQESNQVQFTLYPVAAPVRLITRNSQGSGAKGETVTLTALVSQGGIGVPNASVIWEVVSGDSALVSPVTQTLSTGIAGVGLRLGSFTSQVRATDAATSTSVFLTVAPTMGGCDEIGRVTRNFVSAHQRDRVHRSNLYAAERRCLVTDFNGAIAKGRAIASATWHTDDTSQCVMSLPAVRGRQVQVQIAAQYSGECRIRVDATLDNGEVYSAWHVIRVQPAPCFGTQAWVNGPSKLTAVAA
ncbi:hypothetical protein TP46_12225 [Xanthomonas citri pv. aurantifolii]|nr:hypothetical protein TP46_12225 [Xanthomonas citri pv. aurantifolii]